MLVLAGCTGGGSDGAPTTTGGAGGGNGDAGSGSDGTAPVWDPYDFREGEYYEYEVVESGERLGTVYWETLSVSGDGTSVTVRFGGEVDGEVFETTATGSPETVYTNLLGNPGGPYLFVAFYGPFVGAFQGEALAVGQSWSYSDGQDTLRYAVERTDSVAGRDVFVTVVRLNDEPQYETWVDTRLAFAAKTVVYDDGQPDLEVTLVEFRN